MIRTDRLILRRFERDALPDLDTVLGCPDVMAFSDHGPLNGAAQQSWLEKACDTDRDGPLPGRLAVAQQRGSQVIGYVSLARDQDRLAPGEAELGFRFAKTSWGNGFATEATQALVEFGEDLGALERFVAIVDPNNRRSIRVLTKIGLRYESEVMFDGYDYPDHRYVRTLPR